MQAQYIYETKTNITRKGPETTRVPVGVMVSQVNKQGKLEFGSSFLNPEDAANIARQNLKVRKQIAEVKQGKKMGKAQPAGLKVVPIFDKKAAVALALSRLEEVVDMNKVAPGARAPFRKFIKNAHANRLIKTNKLIIELTPENHAKAQAKKKK